MKLRLARGLRVVYGMVALTASVATAQVPSKPGEWPQWRGPMRDGICHEAGLLREWPKEGPPVVWHVDTVGVGYSSLAVKGDQKSGILYTQGDLDGVEHILALDVATGKTLWAVQPAPVLNLLTEKLANEMKNLDRNKDGEIDEFEALSRFGWDFITYDKPAPGDVNARVLERAAALFKRLDTDADGKLSFAEAGNIFKDNFDKIDLEDKQADVAKLAADRTTELVKQLDKDADGMVSRAESRGSVLDRHFDRIDQRDPATNKGDTQLTADEITTFFSKQQTGRDGVLSPAELTEFYVKAKPAGDGKLTLEELRIPFGGYRNGMGDGPRGTPTVDDNRVYAEGGNGDISCLDALTGKTIWYVNLARDFGGGVPGWGYSESPLVVDGLVIVTPGGKKGTLVALNKTNGELVWSSGEVTEGAHYSSPVVAEIGGVRQIVQFSRANVFGVSIKDGKFLWSYAKPANGTANCCDPIVDQDHVFASSSYGTGGGLAKLTSSNNTFAAEEVYFEKKMDCHHGGIVKLGPLLYSNGGGALTCMDFLTGKILWQNRSVGKGSLIAADNMLYVFSENHEIALVEASPGGYQERGRFKIENHGRPSWAHPIIAGGHLYLRDQGSLTKYDLRTK